MSPYRPRGSGRPEPVTIQIMNRRGVILIDFRFHDGINECLRSIKIPQTGYVQCVYMYTTSWSYSVVGMDNIYEIFR